MTPLHRAVAKGISASNPSELRTLRPLPTAFTLTHVYCRKFELHVWCCDSDLKHIFFTSTCYLYSNVTPGPPFALRICTIFQCFLGFASEVMCRWLNFCSMRVQSCGQRISEALVQMVESSSESTVSEFRQETT